MLYSLSYWKRCQISYKHRIHLSQITLICYTLKLFRNLYFFSRAILAYLANQYGKDDSLYPKDAKKRAIVDQLLYFDIGTLYQGFLNYYVSKYI
jgi:hypothetical protein